ncbi:MAG: glycosyltransferase family 4 protein [Bacteroidales bacterium]
MRLLITTDSFPPGCGGSGWSTYELARGLRARGHEIHVVHVRPGTRGRRERREDGFSVDEIGVPASPVPFVRNYLKNERSYRRLVPVLRAAIRATSADLVHAQHVLSAPPSVTAARLERVPVVCTVRDYWPLCYWSDLIHDPSSASLCPGCSAAMMTRCIRPRAGAAWPLALPLIAYMKSNLRRKRLALADASAVIAVSSVMARDLASRAPQLHGTRIETIPNPVDIDAVMASASAPHPMDGASYAIYVGKLAPNKGSRHLVTAMSRARLPWPLVVVGDGPDRGAVEQAAAREGHDLRMQGWLPRDEALRWLAHASLVVFPSHGPESLSRVLLESAALARPIAAMDTGGTGDIVVHGETGLLARSADELGDAAARLVRDRALAETLGRQAADFVRTHFAAPVVVARVEALYTKLCSAAGRRLETARG